MPGMSSGTATMTCAGVLGLAVGTGAAVELKNAKGGKADSADVSKDVSLKAGLVALGSAVGVPLGWDGLGPRPAAASALSGKAFYYLWSLERICVALGLRTIGKKDWYNWGAELLLANQQANGHWTGDYASYHADTCFALLFLKRANLTDDLGSKLAGLRDPGEKISASFTRAARKPRAARRPRLRSRRGVRDASRAMRRRPRACRRPPERAAPRRWRSRAPHPRHS